MVDGIDLSMLAGLQDWALIGVLVCSFPGVIAAVWMRVVGYYWSRSCSQGFATCGKGCSPVLGTMARLRGTDEHSQKRKYGVPNDQ